MSEEGLDDVRKQHRARFNEKLQEYVAQKKSSQVKTDDNYNEILEAVKGWNNVEKFTDDAIKRNYGRRTKTATEVVAQINSIFCLLGPPKILQTDNGKEFENSTLKEMLKNWRAVR